MITQADINKISAGDPHIVWKQLGIKWSVMKMADASKQGLNEINFDLESLNTGEYRLGIGYGDGEKVSAALAVLESAHPCLNRHPNGSLTYKRIRKTDVLDIAEAAIKTIRNGGLGRDTAIARPGSRPKMACKGWFETRASTLFGFGRTGDWEAFDGAYRSLLGDDRDDIFYIGRSRAAAAATGSNLWREHVVPLVLIREEIIRRLKAGAGRVEIADLLMSNVGVVWITRAEQHLLDVECGLKSTMPPGWKFGESRLARLKSAGIILE